ncbi:hypothetical protein NDU88_001629, partial [Pleurodeles waltl]
DRKLNCSVYGRCSRVPMHLWGIAYPCKAHRSNSPTCVAPPWVFVMVPCSQHSG